MNGYADSKQRCRQAGDHSPSVLLVLFAVLVTFPLLFLLRFLDDNTLASWQWLLTREEFSRLFLFLIVAVLCLTWLARRVHPEKAHPIALFFLGAVWLVPMWQLPEPFVDTSRYFLQAKYLSEYGISFYLRQWGNAVWAWTDLPFSSMVYGMVFRLFGENRLWVLAVNTIFFASALVATYNLGHFLWDRRTGVAAAFLLMAMPLYCSQAVFMMSDAHVLFLLVLSIGMHLKAVERGGWWIAAAACSLAALFLSKYSALLFGMVHLSPAVIALCKKERNGWRRSLAVYALMLAILAFFLMMKHDVLYQQIGLLRAYQVQGLGAWRESLLSTFFFHVHPLVSLLAILSLIDAARRKEKPFFLLGWLVVPVILVGGGRSRYLMPILPIVALFAARGLFVWIPSQWAQRLFILSVVLAAGIQLNGGTNRFLGKISMANLRNAGEWINRHSPDAEVAVHLVPQKNSAGDTFAFVPMLDLYTTPSLFLDKIGVPAPHAKSYQGPLQFTRHMGVPNFYKKTENPPVRLHAIISGEPINSLQAKRITGCGQGTVVGRFWQDSRIFRYQSMVTLIGSTDPC